MEANSSGEAAGGDSIVEAYWSSPRPERAAILTILVFWVLTAIGHTVTWAAHKPPLRPGAVGFVMLVMLALCIWHSWMVKGRRQTIAFFLIAWAISWFCEFIGHNYGWFFGDYKYTETLGPRLGGVPLLIIVTWSVVIYSAFMLIDWLIGIKGEKRVRTWWGKGLWAVLLSATSATLVCAWDLMVDPFATSKVWQTAADKAAWWWWTEGPYLKELEVWKGRGGVPIGNFVGWWLAPFFIVLIFYLLFHKKNLVAGRLINAVPLAIYAYVYFAVVIVVLEMNWFENGMNQVALIGTFTMMPVILAGIVKLVWDYSGASK